MEATASTRRKAVGNGNGSVYQEGVRTGTPGRWVAQVKSDGKFRRTYHPTEAKAKRALRAMVAAVDSGAAIPDGNTTLGELLTRWQDKVLPAQNLSSRTLDGYRWACDLLRDDLGSIRIRKLTPDAVEKAFEIRADNGISRASLVKVRSVLGKALDYAQRRQLVTTNVARIVELPVQARRAAEGRSLTAEQAKLILAATPGHPLHALWVVMLYLGLRPGEAAGLTWTDIDFDNAVIHIRRSLKLERGKLVVDERLKTARSRRSLDAPPPVLQALQAQRDLQAEARLAAAEHWTNTYDLVFATNVGTPLGPRNLQRSLTAVTERLDLGPWHPHELRHSAASLMSAAGVPMERIADQLGHDGTRMGLLVYRHATKPSIDAGNAMIEVLR